MRATLAQFDSADDLRAHLAGGWRDGELRYVGFEQVSLGACIDRVVATTLAERANAGDADARRQSDDDLDLYLAVLREAQVRRSAGAAPCLPGRNAPPTR